MDKDKKPVAPFWLQGLLLIFYIVLSIWFAFNKKTWPISLYYIGCVVKDLGVLILGLMLKDK